MKKFDGLDGLGGLQGYTGYWAGAGGGAWYGVPENVTAGQCVCWPLAFGWGEGGHGVCH